MLQKKKSIFLSTPKYGNQIGALIEGKYFTTLASFSNEVISSCETESKQSKPTETEMTDNKTSKNESRSCFACVLVVNGAQHSPLSFV